MDWWETLEYVGEALVLFGVIGEVLAERKLIFRNEDSRRDAIEGRASCLLIVGLAVSFFALIGTNEHFNGTIASLNLQAQKAGERAAQDERDAAEAQEKAAEATKLAEEEKIQELRLEAKIQPRSYTSAEIAVIDKACKPFAGTSVVMRSMAYDVEGAVFGTYLAKILGSKECGLEVNASGVGDNFMQNLPMFMDVHVTGPDDKQAFINALVGSLNTPRVRAIADPARGATGTPVFIFVGAKQLSPPE